MIVVGMLVIMVHHDNQRFDLLVLPCQILHSRHPMLLPTYKVLKAGVRCSVRNLCEAKILNLYCCSRKSSR
jgi:hypothetical protein